MNDLEKLNFNFSLEQISGEKKFIDSIMDLNAKANNYGLILTEDAAREIVSCRKNALKENERVEIKSDAITRLTSAFLESGFITQHNLAETIGELINIFYYIQNETFHTVSDDDIIAEMFDVFNETCFGDIEIMQSKGLEKILRKHKKITDMYGETDIWDDYEYEEWGSGEYNEYDESWRE